MPPRSTSTRLVGRGRGTPRSLMPITVPAALRTIAPTTSAAAGTRAMKKRTLVAHTPRVRARRRADSDGRAAREPERDAVGVATQRAADELAVAQEPRPVESTGGGAHVCAGSLRRPTHSRSPWSPATSSPATATAGGGGDRHERRADVVVTAVLARARLPAGRETDRGACDSLPARIDRRGGHDGLGRRHLRRDRPAPAEHRRQVERRQHQFVAAPEREPHACHPRARRPRRRSSGHRSCP